MVVLYQLNCAKVIDQVRGVDLEVGDQFSDYDNKSIRSLAVCGLPLAPLPWLSMWEMSLEEREEKETWERTRWTWENNNLESWSSPPLGQRTHQWVRDDHDQTPAYQTVLDARQEEQLPHIVTDHTGREAGEGNKDQKHQKGLTSEIDKALRTKNITVENNCKDSTFVNALSGLDLLKHVNAKHKEDIPIIMDSSSSGTDNEMEDYYENHTDWPRNSS
eukprot:GFUD01005525.1.p1 GENE.GFUD01005525.1~~GFUD01005525.1.p1  ORF type:complete len:218 (+),score=65.40 GFUD01005525.1:28-681(+)